MHGSSNLRSFTPKYQTPAQVRLYIASCTLFSYQRWATSPTSKPNVTTQGQELQKKNYLFCTFGLAQCCSSGNRTVVFLPPPAHLPDLHCPCPGIYSSDWLLPFPPTISENHWNQQNTGFSFLALSCMCWMLQITSQFSTCSCIVFPGSACPWGRVSVYISFSLLAPLWSQTLFQLSEPVQSDHQFHFDSPQPVWVGIYISFIGILPAGPNCLHVGLLCFFWHLQILLRT